MKFLIKLLCLFCVVFQPTFAAPNPLNDIANQALSGISEDEKTNIKNLELQAQIAKQKRINSEMTYKVMQLKEKVGGLSNNIKINNSDIKYYQQLLSDDVLAKNKSLTSLVDKQKQQLDNQQKTIADLKSQNAQFEQKSNDTTQFNAAKDKHNKQITAQKQQVEELTKALEIQSLKTKSAEQKNSNTRNKTLADQQINAQIERYELLFSQFQQLKTSSEKLKNVINKAKQEKQNLTQQNQTLTAKIKDKDQQIIKIQEKTKFYQARLKDAQSKNAQNKKAQNKKLQNKKAQNKKLQNKKAQNKNIKPQIQDNSNLEKNTEQETQISTDDPKSQFKLANDYSANNNHKMALYWYLKVAEKGYASAQFNVGNMYYNGLGAGKDTNRAFSFYLQSAKQNFVEAQYNVGLMYELGEGVLKDEAQSFYWYGKAAEQGHQKAQKALEKLQNNS